MGWSGPSRGPGEYRAGVDNRQSSREPLGRLFSQSEQLERLNASGGPPDDQPWRGIKHQILNHISLSIICTYQEDGQNPWTNTTYRQNLSSSNLGVRRNRASSEGGGGA